jgi:hypothetical protein
VKVTVCDDAQEELRALPLAERKAMYNAFEKLESLGDRLGSPHSSSIVGVSVTLRELRPRAGRSPWRAFYRRIGSEMVVGAIGPEALVSSSGFRQAVNLAADRLRRYGQENSDHD